MKENPEASQKKLAEILGVSPSRVCQLLRKSADQYGYGHREGPRGSGD
ncbi:winged helix-turn-helix transcriptional regulator [Paenibacillus ehimensis]|nr:winged helix-turn-helix transcriptional regulator [Paenibacillus ehimensis]